MTPRQVIARAALLLEGLDTLHGRGAAGMARRALEDATDEQLLQVEAELPEVRRPEPRAPAPVRR